MQMHHCDGLPQPIDWVCKTEVGSDKESEDEGRKWSRDETLSAVHQIVIVVHELGACRVKQIHGQIKEDSNDHEAGNAEEDPLQPLVCSKITFGSELSRTF